MPNPKQKAEIKFAPCFEHFVILISDLFRISIFVFRV